MADYEDVVTGSLVDDSQKEALNRPGLTTSILLKGPVVPVAGGAPSVGDAPYEITVGNPQKQGDNVVTTYISYTVKTRKLREGGSEISVFRRFSDFLWLSDILRILHPTCVVPPVPEKSLNKFSPDLLKYRTRELTRFMQRLACHPVMSQDENLTFFLSATWAELSDRRALRMPNPPVIGPTIPEAAQSQPQAQGKGAALLSSLKHFGQSAGKSITQLQFVVGKSKEEDPEPWFHEQGEALTKMQDALMEVLQSSHVLASKLHEDLAASYSALALAQRTLGKAVASVDDGVSQSCAEVSAASEHQVKLLDELSGHVEHSYHDYVKDFVREIDSIRVVLSERQNYVRRFTIAMQAVASKKAKNSPDLAEAERQRDGAAACLEDFGRLAKADIQRAMAERQAEFARVISGLCTVSRDFMQQSAQAWATASTNTAKAGASSSSAASAPRQPPSSPVKPLPLPPAVAKPVEPENPFATSNAPAQSTETTSGATVLGAPAPAANSGSQSSISSPYTIDD